MNGFSFTITPGPVITLTGDLDLHTAPELRTALVELAERAQAGDELVLELGGLEFIDSSGLSVFIAVHKRTAARGARVRLSNVPPMPSRVLDVTGLGALFADAN